MLISHLIDHRVVIGRCARAYYMAGFLEARWRCRNFWHFCCSVHYLIGLHNTHRSWVML